MRDGSRPESFDAVQAWFDRLEQPAFGSVTGGQDLAVHDGQVAFAGSTRRALTGTADTVLCLHDREGLRVVGSGPHDRLPAWSPAGDWLASIGDDDSGRPGLQLRAAGDLGAPPHTPDLGGIVEALAWSPSGRAVVAVVAEPDADRAGGAGSGGYGDAAPADVAAWAPELRSWPQRQTWRRAVVLTLAESRVDVVSPADLTVWEVSWAGEDRVVAVVSDSPDEAAWYDARLVTISCTSGAVRTVYESPVQLGLPAGCPSGRRAAFVEAVCSDRQVVAGEVMVADLDSGDVRRADSCDVDVTALCWRGDARLVYVGVRDLDVVAGETDLESGTARETWRSTESCGSRYPELAADAGDCFVVCVDGYHRPPELLAVDGASETVLHSFAHDGTSAVAELGGVLERQEWAAPDGLEIQGLLVRPDRAGPHPLVLNIHGGPVWAWRNRWGMANASRPAFVPLLVAAGYAVLNVNPRGSSGRGRAFAELVRGDMGGADTFDFTSGVDAMVRAGKADPTRIGTTGISYGGYMSSWLVTQDSRFAASVPISPVTDWVSQHYTSNIGGFDELFLASSVTDPAGRHLTRSPVRFADRVRTPVLNITGGLDRCTPPGQAQEFHQALAAHQVRTELAIYPQEGHGIAAFPAAIDAIARTLDWFMQWMPAEGLRP